MRRVKGQGVGEVLSLVGGMPLISKFTVRGDSVQRQEASDSASVLSVVEGNEACK